MILREQLISPYAMSKMRLVKWLIIIFLFSCANLKTLTYKTNHSVIKSNHELATVYFLRGQNLSGVNFVIHDEFKEMHQSNPIGILSSSSFFHVTLKPGQHSFYYSDAWKENKPGLDIKLEKSKVYYIVMTEINTGSYSTNAYTHIYTVGGKLAHIDENSARKILPDLLEIDLEANKKLFNK